MAIDATIAGANANSYQTLQEAEEYFATRLHSDAWDGAANTDKQKALIEATRTIDRVATRIGPPPQYWLRNWTARIPWNYALLGFRYDIHQKLKFPRWWDRNLATNEVYIPQDIRYAQCEIAIWLLEKGADQIQREKLQAQGVTQVRIDDLQEVYDPSTGNRTLLPQAAFEYLRPYLGGAVPIR